MVFSRLCYRALAAMIGMKLRLGSEREKIGWEIFGSEQDGGVSCEPSKRSLSPTIEHTYPRSGH